MMSCLSGAASIQMSVDEQRPCVLAILVTQYGVEEGTPNQSLSDSRCQLHYAQATCLKYIPSYQQAQVGGPWGPLGAEGPHLTGAPPKR